MDNLEKTRELNSNGEGINGLYPIPDGKIYLAVWSDRHDGEYMFYAVDDESAIQYVKESHPSKLPTTLSEATISYREILFFDVGMQIKVPIGQYEIVTKSDDEDWGETGRLINTDMVLTGILLKYADHPNYGWNTYLPAKDFIILVPEIVLKEKQ